MARGEVVILILCIVSQTLEHSWSQHALLLQDLGMLYHFIYYLKPRCYRVQAFPADKRWLYQTTSAY